MELGLIGRSLSHSFSYRYFDEKFKKEGLTNCYYRNYELNEVKDFRSLMKDHPELKGLNVTVPYKSEIISYLDELDPVAREIGAVNTILIKGGHTTGYNTDHLGFRESLTPFLTDDNHRALVLGSGGASRAVQYTLDQLGIPHEVVSRKPAKDQLSYEVAGQQLASFDLVINCTPLGTYPQSEEMPPLTLDNVSENHLFYDLIYNPEKSRLLSEAEKRGARVKNGYEMLILQAEAAWKIWHED